MSIVVNHTTRRNEVSCVARYLHYLISHTRLEYSCDVIERDKGIYFGDFELIGAFRVHLVLPYKKLGYRIVIYCITYEQAAPKINTKPVKKSSK